MTSLLARCIPATIFLVACAFAGLVETNHSGQHRRHHHYTQDHFVVGLPSILSFGKSENFKCVYEQGMENHTGA